MKIKEVDANDPNVKLCGVTMDLDLEKTREWMKHPGIDVNFRAKVCSTVPCFSCLKILIFSFACFARQNGETHLHRAVVLGDIPILEELIARGAEVNGRCLVT